MKIFATTSIISVLLTENERTKLSLKNLIDSLRKKIPRERIKEILYLCMEGPAITLEIKNRQELVDIDISLDEYRELTLTTLIKKVKELLEKENSGKKVIVHASIEQESFCFNIEP